MTTTPKLVAALLLSLVALTSCATDEAGSSGDLGTTSSSSTVAGTDGTRPAAPALPPGGAGADRVPTSPTPDDPCTDLLARARITSRDPAHFWTVTGLDGEISNPSSTAVRVTAVSLQFEPGTPPGVHTAELTVPLDLTLAPGSSAPWTWTGALLVRPFHDDAPLPVVHDLECGT